MPKENVLEENKAVDEQPIESVEKETTETEKPEGLTLRDALEVGLEATKSNESKKEANEPRRDGKGSSNQTKIEVQKGANSTGKTTGSEPTSTSDAPPLKPPAEYTKEEAEDFLQLSRKGQEAAIRIHQGRTGKLEEVKAAISELNHLKKLNEDVTPFLKAMGVKESSPVAIQKALQMWKEFEEAPDPRKAAANYLRAKGVEIPKEFLSNEGADKIDPKIASLQEELKNVTDRLAQEDRAKVEATLNQAWSSFESEKNAAGTVRFPSLTNTEEGLKLSSNIGSLVSGQSDLSRQFIANAKARIPDLTYPKLFEEAYKWYGGKVDDSEAPRSQSQDTNHIARSRRAASSVPGRGAQTASKGPAKKFGSYREAAAAALAEIKESEGA